MKPLLRAGAWLALPLCLLLFLQWPVREYLPGPWARRANDAGQVVFALYAALAVAAATVQGAHVAARGRWKASRAKAWAGVLLVAPWALFMVWTALPGVWQSVYGLEQFADTLNSGYFLIRVAMLVLPLLALAAAWALARPQGGWDD